MPTPDQTTIAIPQFALVALIGASGSGKTTFARAHFRPTEILSSDYFRALISDDENSLEATDDAFAALHFVAARRLANLKLTAVDATNVQTAARQPLVELARQYHAIPVAIVLDLPEAVCRQRNENRPDRDLGPHVVGQQCQQLRRSLKHLKREGFRRVYVLKSAEEIARLRITREKLWTDRRHEQGPFDIIGDVHGCAAELRTLLEELGYAIDGPRIIPPPGRQAVFLGDLADRGPDIPGVLELVMGMVEAGAAISAQQEHDDLLDIADVTGKRRIDTRLQPRVTVRAEHAAAALEVMSRYAADPKWLIYLPPTMSPCETSARPDLLEYPDEAFAYFRKNGVDKAICEEKHMGSRAVVVLCRDPDIARQRFGILEEETGICYTRTGRRFFADCAVETEFLARLGTAVSRAGLWDTLDTDWLALDGELMPWSAKAQQLLQDQYAAVGTAARLSLDQTIAVLKSAAAGNAEVEALLENHLTRREMVDKYIAAYRAYCWPVHSVDDLSLAPFHLLASEGRVHCDQDHSWHMETLAQLCAADPGLLRQTATQLVDLTDPDSQAAAVRWWEDLTARNGEGMVVKPLAFVAHGPCGLVQPAVKCRGPEYLRIIYGPEYTAPAHLAQLRQRGLKTKRSLALREFALGIEALERFVRREPLRRVHECVFGILALESEPVDPRL